MVFIVMMWKAESNFCTEGLESVGSSTDEWRSGTNSPR